MTFFVTHKKLNKQKLVLTTSSVSYTLKVTVKIVRYNVDQQISEYFRKTVFFAWNC